MGFNIRRNEEVKKKATRVAPKRTTLKSPSIKNNDEIIPTQVTTQAINVGVAFSVLDEFDEFGNRVLQDEVKQDEVKSEVETQESTTESEVESEVKKKDGKQEKDYTLGEDLIKVKAKFTYCLFPRFPAILGTEDNTFGVTKWWIMEVEEGEPICNNKGELTVIGNFNEPLDCTKPYIILGKKKDTDYGVEYELLYLHQQIDLNQLNNQRAFLRTFLTDGQISEFYKIYDNPLKIIAAHDIEAIKKVHGVGDYIANCIVNRYEENKDMTKVYIELDSYGLTPNFMHKLVTTYKNPDTIIKMVREHPYDLIYDVDGVGFKTADRIALSGGLDPKSVERVKAYIMFYLESESVDNGNSYIRAGELVANIYNYFDGKNNILSETIDENGDVVTNIAIAIQQLCDEGYVVLEDNDNKSMRRIYLARVWNLENEIKNNLLRLLKAPNHFNYINYEEKIKELEKRQGFDFAKEQLDGIKLALQSQVCLICGLAGSGKSSLVSGVLASLDEYSFAQCALSGKAAARLQEVTGHEGSTIHRLLEYKEGTFMYDENNPLPYNIIILDEVSLVGGDIFLSLIKAIPSGSKLILLGDMGQLESIGELNLAADIYHSDVIPTVELKEIHRQAAKSGIITSAHRVRKKVPLHESGETGIDVRGELQDMIFDLSDSKDGILQRAVAWFNKYYNSKIVNKNIMDIQLIAPVKERGEACVYNLNIEAQKIVNPINPDAHNDCLVVGKKEHAYHIYEGDKVMCIKNNYKTVDDEGGLCPIFNGWTGIVDKIGVNEIIVDFPLAGGKVHIELKDARNELTLGYAASVHKLQGSDIPVIVGAIDYSTPPSMLTSQLVYTLLTRAKKRAVLVAQTPALNKAIMTDYVSTKRTFLPELLEKG